MFSTRAITTAALLLGAVSLNGCGWFHHSAPPPEQEPPPAPMQPMPPPAPPEALPPAASRSAGDDTAERPRLRSRHRVDPQRQDPPRQALADTEGGAGRAHHGHGLYRQHAGGCGGTKKKGIADNNDLSQKRADAVVAYLTAKGIDPGSISGQGQGEQNPVAPNTTARGRAQNGRIEIAVSPPG